MEKITWTFLEVVRKGTRTPAWSVQFSCTGQATHYSNVPSQKTSRDSLLCFLPCTRAKSAALFNCVSWEPSSQTLPALETQCLRRQHFSGNKSIIFFLTKLIGNCCPEHTTLKLIYSSFFKCQTLLYKTSML